MHRGRGVVRVQQAKRADKVSDENETPPTGDAIQELASEAGLVNPDKLAGHRRAVPVTIGA